MLGVIVEKQAKKKRESKSDTKIRTCVEQDSILVYDESGQMEVGLRSLPFFLRILCIL